MWCSLNPAATRLHKNLHRLREQISCYFLYRTEVAFLNPVATLFNKNLNRIKLIFVIKWRSL